jgi:hypothetical protein
MRAGSKRTYTGETPSALGRHSLKLGLVRARLSFSSELIEGVIVSRPNRFLMTVKTGGDVFRCRRSATGRLGDMKIDESGVSILRCLKLDLQCRWEIQELGRFARRHRRYLLPSPR